jgi:hypothetical protein
MEVLSGLSASPARSCARWLLHSPRQRSNQKRLAPLVTRPTVVMALLQPEGKEAIVSFRVRRDDDMRATVAAMAMQLGLIE